MTPIGMIALVLLAHLGISALLFLRILRLESKVRALRAAFTALIGLRTMNFKVGEEFIAGDDIGSGRFVTIKDGKTYEVNP